MGINIIVEHILGGMWFVSTEDSFGYMVIQLGFSFSRVSHIYKTSKGLKGGEVLSVGCSFLNRRSNCIRLWKIIGKLDSIVQVIWPNFDIQVGSSYHSSYIVG